MRNADAKVQSIADVLKLLSSQTKAGRVVWFRGQSKSAWKLVPSLARNPAHLGAENALLKRFMQDAVPHTAKWPGSEWEWMFLMQHHRAPTRLLDWTESPLAGLYFAVTSQPKAEGAVWCLDPVALNSEANLKFLFEGEIPAFGRDDVTGSYLPSRVHEGSAVLNPIAIVGPRNTARMAAQLGTFTINHRQHLPIESIGAAKHVWRWTIPPNAKSRIQKELKLLGVNVLTMFPELDRVAEVSKEILP
jgi:hypothetical protein